MEKLCPCCRKKFVCKYEDFLSCQCTRIYLPVEILAYIDEFYFGCICLQCQRSESKFLQTRFG
ncbi:MAG: cysteine-rich CWC family protein [Prevotella sp.]|nr:cysteine-rich CWC family protein [Prevotella sp.]